MNRDEKRVALAKLDGWTNIETVEIPRPSSFCGVMKKMVGVNRNGARDEVSDYLNDLNAIHRLWCKLTPEQHSQFRVALQSIVVRDGHVCGPCRSLSNATAEQRAEAILKTFNLWTE